MDVLLTDGNRLQVTEYISAYSYEFTPKQWVSEQFGEEFMKNFIILFDDKVCINKNNLKDFSYLPDSDPKFTWVVANFKNGHSEQLYGLTADDLRKTKKDIEKQFNKNK